MEILWKLEHVFMQVTEHYTSVFKSVAFSRCDSELESVPRRKIRNFHIELMSAFGLRPRTTSKFLL